MPNVLYTPRPEVPLSCQADRIIIRLANATETVLTVLIPSRPLVTLRTNGETSSSNLLHLGFTRLPILLFRSPVRSLSRVASSYPYSLHLFCLHAAKSILR
jgi:hypothetical protein